MRAALSLYSGSGKYAETVAEVWNTTKTKRGINENAALVS